MGSYSGRACAHLPCPFCAPKSCMRYIGILLEFSENMRYIGISDPQNEVYWYGIEIRSKSEISNNEVYWYIWPNFGKVRYFGMKPHNFYCSGICDPILYCSPVSVSSCTVSKLRTRNTQLPATYLQWYTRFGTGAT